MSDTKHTPGPWRWELNMTSKVIQLCGGRPTFDKTVMDFTRWGMGRAAPRFQSPIDPHRLMTRAEHFGVVVAGREHHQSWFKGIDQPDANLIAAAPELYEAVAKLVEWWDREESGPEYSHPDREKGPNGREESSAWFYGNVNLANETHILARAALAKARGEA